MMIPQTSLDDVRFYKTGARTQLLESRRSSYGTKCEMDELPSTFTEIESRPWECLTCIWRRTPDWFPVEFVNVFNLSWSLFVISLFNFLMSPICLMFVGHLGTDKLAGVAMAATLLNVTGISIGAGLTTACDTVFAQSMGSKNKSIMGVYLAKSVIIILLFVFPCWGIHLNTERMLLAMGQDPVISRIAGNYLVSFMPGLPCVFITQILMQYLRCQDIIWPTMVIGALGCLVNVLFHWLFLIQFNLDTIGSSYAMVITFFSMATMLVVYIWLKKIHLRTWKGWCIDIVQDWGMFIELAVAGMLMIGLEWGAYEASIITSGLLSPVALGATSLTFQVIVIVYMVPTGIGLACNIRVGQHVGAGNITQAKRTINVGMGLCFVCAVLICALMGLLRYEIPKMFSDDPEVIAYSAAILPIAGLVEFFDGFAGVCGGILRGCGRQVIGTAVMLCGFYVLGLPIGLSLMFYTNMEVPGLYWGLTVGVAVESMFFLAIVFRTNWPEMIRLAQIRTGTEITMSDRESGRIHSRKSSGVSVKHGLGSSCHLSRLSIPTEMLIATSRPCSTRALIMKRTFFILFMIMFFVVGGSINVSLGPIHDNVFNTSTMAPSVNDLKLYRVI